jgi:diadenosine tetraphosphate (Ap4A) HIT family hydrolase
VVAFLADAPVNPGHLLVIPTSHARGLADLDPDLGAPAFAAAQRLAAALRASALHCEGINLFLADGEAASQLVAHLHLHVIPRFAGDHFELNPRGGVTTGKNRPSRDELHAAAASIRAVQAGFPPGPGSSITSTEPAAVPRRPRLAAPRRAAGFGAIALHGVVRVRARADVPRMKA